MARWIDFALSVLGLGLLGAIAFDYWLPTPKLVALLVIMGWIHDVRGRRTP